MTENQETCRNCGSPLKPGMKFCESCGARIEAPSSCPQCGATVAASAKFCESCGTPLVTAAPPVSPVPETVPASSPAEPANAEESPVPAAAPVLPSPETAPAPEALLPAESPGKEKIPLPLPDKKPAAALAKEPSRPEKAPEAPKETAPKKPVPQQTMVIAVVIVLALLAAAVFFVVLPMLSGPGTTSQNQQVPPSPTGSVGSATTVAAGQTGPVSFIPGPTDVPPYNRAVVVDVERDAITSVITVTFQGGEGQYGVRELLVTLTRSDGTVETKSFKPEFRGTFTTLQGTQKTDRVEVTANFYNGESYKIIDKIFEYKKRGG